MTTKERLHELVDELSDEEAKVALVIVERRRDDPMLHALAAAPLDDECSDADEDATAAEALEDYRRGAGRWVPSSELAALWKAPADPTLEADLEKTDEP